MNGNYKDIFDQLSYGNKVVFNDLSDLINEKKLNRLAKNQILTFAAASALEYQNRNEPLENLFGSDMNFYCEKICEGAPKASFVEKLFAQLRNTAGYSIILSIIVLAQSLHDGRGWFIEGIYALQMTAGVTVAALCFPLVCFRDAMHMPGNIIFPRNPLSTRSFISLAAYSAICIAAIIFYVVLFFIYPSMLIENGWDYFKLNVLAWVIISTVVFVISFISERYLVKQNFDRNYQTT